MQVKFINTKLIETKNRGSYGLVDANSSNDVQKQINRFTKQGIKVVCKFTEDYFDIWGNGTPPDKNGRGFVSGNYPIMQQAKEGESFQTRHCEMLMEFFQDFISKNSHVYFLFPTGYTYLSNERMSYEYALPPREYEEVSFTCGGETGEFEWLPDAENALDSLLDEINEWLLSIGQVGMVKKQSSDIPTLFFKGMTEVVKSLIPVQNVEVSNMTTTFFSGWRQFAASLSIIAGGVSAASLFPNVYIMPVIDENSKDEHFVSALMRGVLLDCYSANFMPSGRLRTMNTHGSMLDANLCVYVQNEQVCEHIAKHSDLLNFLKGCGGFVLCDLCRDNTSVMKNAKALQRKVVKFDGMYVMTVPPKVAQSTSYYKQYKDKVKGIKSPQIDAILNVAKRGRLLPFFPAWCQRLVLPKIREGVFVKGERV